MVKKLNSRESGRLCLVRALAFLALLGGSVAGADMPVPGMHGYKRYATVDLGPYADYTVRWYRVGKGDTLSEISERYLGKTNRWEEITALNPGLTAETLKAETEILLPPILTPLEPDETSPQDGEARMWWDFFTRAMPAGVLERLDVDGKIPPSPYGGTQLVAVRHDKTAELLRELSHQGSDPNLLERLEQEGQAVFSVSDSGLALFGTIEDASPIVRQEAAYRVTSITGGRIQLELLFERAYTADGREVALDARRFQRWDLVWIALAAAALLLILWRWRARRSGDFEAV